MPPFIFDNLLLKKKGLLFFLPYITYQIAWCTLQYVCSSAMIVKHLEFHKQASCKRIQRALFQHSSSKLGLKMRFQDLGYKYHVRAILVKDDILKVVEFWWNNPLPVKIVIALLGTWMRSASEVAFSECAQSVLRVCSGGAQVVPRGCSGCAQSVTNFKNCDSTSRDVDELCGWSECSCYRSEV